MASPTFGLFGGNGAPNPPVFSGTNPTGNRFNFGGKGIPLEGSTFPSFGLFGNPNSMGVSSPVSPMANMPVFSGGMQGLSSGLYSSLNGMPGNPGDHLFKELTSAYGKGLGTAIFNMLIGGTFNPKVANAFLNAMQPSINRGEGNILTAFGAEGSRFGSAASLGLGDYLSQVNLNEQQTLANMYMQGQQQELSLLGSIMPTLHAEQANKGGFWHDILGGLETAAGVALEFVPGGQVAGTALIGSGVGTLASGLDHSGSGGGGGGSNPLAGLDLSSLFNKNSSSSSSSNPMEIPSINNNTFWDTYSYDALSGSAGDAILAG